MGEPKEHNLPIKPEDEGKIVSDYYQQACNSVRAYMDLRFKHFGTFVVIVILLFGGVIKLSNEWEKAICSIVGFLVSLLFWILDYRTGQYLAKHWGDVYKLENYFRSKVACLSKSVPLSGKPKRKPLLRASMITNYLFFLFSIVWLLTCILHFDRNYQWGFFQFLDSAP